MRNSYYTYTVITSHHQTAQSYIYESADNMTSRTYYIPASKQTLVEQKLIKLNARAIKIGANTFSWSFDKAIIKTIDSVIKKSEDSDPEIIEERVPVIPVIITGVLKVHYNDWEFVATLQHLRTGENIIRTISSTNIPIHFRESGSACDHCEVNRYRKDTYLVKNNNDVFMQVGSSCMKEFLGGNSPDNILKQAELYAELSSFMEGVGSGSTSGDVVFHIIDFLAMTSVCIRDYGWTSRTKAKINNTIATTTYIYDNLLPGGSLSDNFKLSTPTQQDYELAQQAADWAESLRDSEVESSDYLHNIRAIVRSGLVNIKCFGFAASIISAYQKTLTPIKVQESQHLGSVKDKVVWELTLNFQHYYHTSYGTTYIYVFKDSNNNEVVWKASSDNELVNNTKYLVKGAIKAHSEYKGVPQTILTRCKVTNAINH